jgi:hypothetical protein
MLRATLCALLIVVATPLGAQEQKRWQAPGPVQTEVALALVLAVDASGSVSDDRFELQKQGYAAAFGGYCCKSRPAIVGGQNCAMFESERISF